MSFPACSQVKYSHRVRFKTHKYGNGEKETNQKKVCGLAEAQPVPRVIHLIYVVLVSTSLEFNSECDKPQ